MCLRHVCTGRLGLGVEVELHCVPQELTLALANMRPVQAFCGLDSSMLLTDTGLLLATGSNRWLYNIFHGNELCLLEQMLGLLKSS